MDTSALLIIDQQKGIDHPRLGKRNNPNAEAIILALLTHWRKQGRMIVHIKHRSSEPISVFWPFQDGFDFKPDFEPVNGEIVIEKTTPCAFTRTGLESILVQSHAGCVIIAGVSTNNSIEATARTAGCRGFATYVVEDACFAFAKSDYYGNPRSADEVHAMSLANLEGEYATVISSRRLFAASTKI